MAELLFAQPAWDNPRLPPGKCFLFIPFEQKAYFLRMGVYMKKQGLSIGFMPDLG